MIDVSFVCTYLSGCRFVVAVGSGAVFWSLSIHFAGVSVREIVRLVVQASGALSSMKSAADSMRGSDAGDRRHDYKFDGTTVVHTVSPHEFFGGCSIDDSRFNVSLSDAEFRSWREELDRLARDSFSEPHYEPLLSKLLDKVVQSYDRQPYFRNLSMSSVMGTKVSGKSWCYGTTSVILDCTINMRLALELKKPSTVFSERVLRQLIVEQDVLADKVYARNLYHEIFGLWFNFSTAVVSRLCREARDDSVSPVWVNVVYTSTIPGSFESRADCELMLRHFKAICAMSEAAFSARKVESRRVPRCVHHPDERGMHHRWRLWYYTYFAVAEHESSTTAPLSVVEEAVAVESRVQDSHVLQRLASLDLARPSER